MERKLYWGMALVSVIAITVSLLIFLDHSLNNANLNNVCSITKTSCQSVQDSVYGRTFGIENSILGITGFSLIMILVFLQLKFKYNLLKIMIILGSVIAGLMSLRFVYIQGFILREYCFYCLIVDLMGIVLLILGAFMVTKQVHIRIV